jgi:hypothetical protein
LLSANQISPSAKRSIVFQCAGHRECRPIQCGELSAFSRRQAYGGTSDQVFAAVGGSMALPFPITHLIAPNIRSSALRSPQTNPATAPGLANKVPHLPNKSIIYG